MSVRLPAEFEPHACTVLAWPSNRADWPGKLPAVQWAFVEYIRHCAASEPVCLVVPSDKEGDKVRRMLNHADVDLDRVVFLTVALDRGWMRDCLPLFVHEGPEVRARHFGFNAWAKYPNWQLDARLPEVLCKRLKISRDPVRAGKRMVILEGGAIDSNGQGTLLTTEECLLDPDEQVRNPGWDAKAYEQLFRDQLGIEQVIWLGEGIAGDDTHGHVDDLCRFVSADTVVLCDEPDSNDENHRALRENRERLQGVRLANGKKLKVVPLPMPTPLYFQGLRLPASYANFYITNEAVLVPTFNDPRDRVALGILADLFPKRRVIGIHAVDLVWGFGTVHCLSHEVPAQEIL